MREFLHLVGRELAEIAHEDGILTAAFKSRVPIYCPDLLASPLSVGISRCRFEKKIERARRLHKGDESELLSDDELGDILEKHEA